jgi:hypothetical protein
MRTRPGLVGICASNDPMQDVTSMRFCIDDSDCTTAGQSCQRSEGGDASGRVCLNWPAPAAGGVTPRKRCETDGDCGLPLCALTVPGCGTHKACVGPSQGGFWDLEHALCLIGGDGSECVPSGACADPEIKYGKKMTGNAWAYELTSDPDEIADRLAGGGVGQCLRCLLDLCACAWETWAEGDPDPTQTCFPSDPETGFPLPGGHACAAHCSSTPPGTYTAPCTCANPGCAP